MEQPSAISRVDAASRRDIIKLLLAGGMAAAVGSAPPARATALRTRARIVVVGGGAAGLTAASRLSRQLDGAEILMIEPSGAHIYQPGLTLVGAGVWQIGQLLERTERFVAAGVRWLQASVTAWERLPLASMTSEARWLWKRST